MIWHRQLSLWPSATRRCHCRRFEHVGERISCSFFLNHALKCLIDNVQSETDNRIIQKVDMFSEFGQSGAHLSIITDENFLRTVRKTFSNLRGTRQYKKHLEAIRIENLGISIPSILEPLENLTYGMQYISGINLGSFLRIASKREVLAVQEIILSYFDTIMLSSKGELGSESILKLREKFASLEIAILKYNDPGFTELLDKVKHYFISADIKSGWNHGDFSLENLIITNNSKSVFAIDFLDSPFDSPYIDLGRFWLDVKYGWWGNGIATGSNEIMNSRVLEDGISERFKQVEIQKIEYFAAFSLLRILPYTTNPVRLAFLKSACWNLRRNLA